jgi:hypothetical protein
MGTRTESRRKAENAGELTWTLFMLFTMACTYIACAHMGRADRALVVAVVAVLDLLTYYATRPRSTPRHAAGRRASYGTIRSERA